MNNNTPSLAVAICSYNRASRLPKLIKLLREQDCPIPFTLMVINNNSSDNTLSELKQLQHEPGPELIYFTEHKQGITYARNRAIDESIDYDYIYFIDDDELPEPGLLAAAVDALKNEGALCTGGCIASDLKNKPKWLIPELLGFLGENSHGDTAFWITSASTPIWSGNIAYNTILFRNDTSLRFDNRYNRDASGIGGGSDAIMFHELLNRKIKMRYRPDMVIKHQVEMWRLKRLYFLKLHFLDGRRKGQFELPCYQREIMGIPPFLIKSFFRQAFKTLYYYLTYNRMKLRQAMNTTHALGMINGYLKKSQ